MDFFKRIPLHFTGELHDVRLINFTVDMNEVASSVPAHIKVRDFNGRAMISMVDVKLRNMRPTIMPLLPFNYRHVAFRLLIDDSKLNDGINKGIYFIKGFTQNSVLIAGSTLLTDYKLSKATIDETESCVTVTQQDNHVTYRLCEGVPADNQSLKEIVGSIDRAYAMLGDRMRVTQIQRERWPLKAVNCTGFDTSFFKTAQFVGAFRVFETIHYDWLPSKFVD
ncbi:DUF2071 domain-containing protein [Chryseolinea sp. T2]|uniref:DUF2071 domain-containing protein n=1 Tax=Chryseolinea sp. T2 TaxID=3129255 RepID=UPI003077AE33